MLSFTEKNYVKVLLQTLLNEVDKEGIVTNEMKNHLNITPATANHLLNVFGKTFFAVSILKRNCKEIYVNTGLFKSS